MLGAGADDVKSRRAATDLAEMVSVRSNRDVRIAARHAQSDPYPLPALAGDRRDSVNHFLGLVNTS